ncbi:MAG: FRG domain-containing protein [Burkholderiales bacterium]
MPAPDQFELRFEFPGEGGRPEALRQLCPLYPDVGSALEALQAHAGAAGAEFTTEAELDRIVADQERTRTERQAAGQPLLEAIKRSAPVLPRRFLFRGQADSRWAFLPSLFQGLDWGPLPWTRQKLEQMRDAIVRRNAWTQRFTADLMAASRSGAVDPAIATFNPTQQHLAARHYSFPSDYLDFTTSPGVAAFFATTNATPRRIGILYALDIHRLYDAIGMASTGARPDGSLEVMFPAYRIGLPGTDRSVVLQAFRDLVFSMATVPLARVRAQSAVFLDVGTEKGFSYDDPKCVFDEYWLWNALDFISDKFLFRQSGARYEDADAKVTDSCLLLPDDPLDRFASEWRSGNPL